MQDTAISLFIFGTFLMLFVLHPAFLFIRYALAERYRLVHEGVAAELQRRALDLAKKNAEEKIARASVKENPKVAEAVSVSVNFGSLDYFLSADSLLQEKATPNAASAAVAPSVSSRSHPATSLPLESRPALIEDVPNILDRRQPLEGWRHSFGASSIFFNSVWGLYVLVFWVIAFSTSSNSFDEAWMKYMVAPVLFVTALSFYLWGKHSQFSFKINAWVRVLEVERIWLEGKIRDGQRA